MTAREEFERQALLRVARIVVIAISFGLLIGAVMGRGM